LISHTPNTSGSSSSPSPQQELYLISTTPAAQQLQRMLQCTGGFARKKERKEDLQE